MKVVLSVVVVLFHAVVLYGQHAHFVAGAVLPVAGAKLIAVNSNDYVHTSRYVRTLNLSPSGTYAGYYNASCPFIVAAATPEFGGPEANAPALGSFIEMDFISLQGPSGGKLGYWEAGRTGSPTFTMSTGTTNGTNRIALSDATLGAGQTGADPFGHVHGRRFTADVPGFYTLGYRFVDTSRNGPTGGAIHTESEVYYLYLQAGYTAPFISWTGGNVDVTFGTILGQSFYVQYKESLGSSEDWVDLHGPVPGDDRLQTLRHTAIQPLAGFYRIKVVPQ